MDNLSESLEDYLEVIAELSATDGHAHVKDIADHLQVKMPSVTGALRQLARLNYVTYSSHQPVELTLNGRGVADRVIKRHQILKRFFCDILGMSAEKASDVACKLEHIIDDIALARFTLFTEAIATRTDAFLLKSYLTEAAAKLDSTDTTGLYCVLSDVQSGERVVFDRTGRGLKDPPPFKTGGTIHVESVSLDRSIFSIQYEKKNVTIARADAEHIWVKRCIKSRT